MKLTIKDFPQVKLDRRQYGADKEPVTHTGPWVILDTDIAEYMPPVMYRHFQEWMTGQTMMSIGNIPAYFLDDVDRFLEEKAAID